MKIFAVLALASLLAVFLWNVKDYGAVESKLDQVTIEKDTIIKADTERKEMQAAEAGNVIEAIDNKSWRNQQTETLKQQATDHERKIEHTRSTVNSLSAITVERMRQFASKTSVREQLGSR